MTPACPAISVAVRCPGASGRPRDPTAGDRPAPELEKFNPELVVKQRVVAVSKADMLDEELKQEIRAQLKGVDVLFFSSVTEQGVDELLDVLWKTVSADV